MKLKTLTATLTLVFLPLSSLTIGLGQIIPQPLELEKAEDDPFVVSSDTKIFADKECLPEATYLANKLAPALGFKPAIVQKAQDATSLISLKLKYQGNRESEAYQLHANSKGISINAHNRKGIFYGIQSLLQLMPVEVFSKEKVNEVNWTVPAITIKDQPRFAWRGMHLDVGRHVFPVDDIKSFIDTLAIHKLNTFHWHLTEDQGWRVEIKKYPKLTEVGAFRASTPPYGNRNGSDNQRYGGFYTQDQIKEIVAYAAKRHITIVPEIDMPGHMAAAIASYPKFGNIDVPNYEPTVATRWGVLPYVLSPTEETFKFVDDVLTEICELFPSKYIHIGGDEAPKDQWHQSKQAQQVIKREGLKNEHELQSYFIRRVEKILESKGRRLIGWDEIREGGLSPNATVMSWRGVEGGLASAREGHDVVMAPNSHTYFDHYQMPSDLQLAMGKEFEAIGGFLPINKVYAFDPVQPKDLTQKEQKHVLGVQAQLWTEYMKTWEKVEFQAFPRVAAIAEVAWTEPKRKDLNDFLDRLGPMMLRYDKLGINHSKLWLPKIPRSQNGAKVTTSLPAHGENYPEFMYDGNPRTFFWSSRPPKKGDHLTLSLKTPLNQISSLQITTGGEGKQKDDVLKAGKLEASRDGKKWKTLGLFKAGKINTSVPKGAQHIRITSTQGQDTWLIVKEWSLKAK